MTLMQWKYTNGFSPDEFVTTVSMTDSIALTDEQKDIFIDFTCSAASKVLTLGLDAGQHAIITNVGGTNAVTVKNIAGDTGVSVAAGKVALAIGGSSTADTCVIKVLN